jgi:hypothetical protein
MSELIGNPFAHLTEYGLHHLAMHLERAGRDKELHRVLAWETSERHNAWYEIKESIGDTEGYLSDVNRAWRLAEGEFVTRQSLLAIGKQCRYVLIFTSLNSLAHNIPPALLAALVERCLWTPSQGLAYARQVPGQEVRAEALAQLAPYLPLPLLEQTLVATRTIRLSSVRAEVLGRLAPHLPKPLLEKVVAEAQELPRQDDLGRNPHLEALIELLPHLDLAKHKQIPQELMEEIRVLPDRDGLGRNPRVEALIKIAPYLPELEQEKALQQALEEACASKYEDWRRWELTRLAPHLPAGLLEKALAAVRTIGSARDRAWALLGLIPYLPAPIRDQAIGETLSAARQPWTGHESLHKSPVIPREIRLSSDRAATLAKVAIHLPKQEREDVQREALSLAVALPERIDSGKSPRAEALARLGHYLPKSLLKEVMNAVRQLPKESRMGISPQAKALEGLAPYLSETLLQEALGMVPELPEGRQTAEAITQLAIHLAELGDSKQALTMIQEIELGKIRASALVRIAPFLPMPLIEKALRALHEIEDAASRVDVLCGLAPHLPKSEQKQALEQALEEALGIGDVTTQAAASAGMIPYLSQQKREQAIRETLTLAWGIGDARDRMKILVELSPYLSESLLDEMLTEIQRIEWESDRVEALQGLAPNLPNSLLDQAITVAYTFSPSGRLAYALAGLASYLPEPSLVKALKAARDIPERGIINGNLRGEALVGLAPYLSETLLDDALDIARTIKDLFWRVKAVTKLALCLSNPGRRRILCEALDTVRMIKSDIDRSKALKELVPHLPELLLEEVLTLAREISNKSSRAGALLSIVPYLCSERQEQVLRESLALTQTINQTNQKAQFLAESSLWLAVLGHPVDALRTAQTIRMRGAKVDALVGIAPHLSTSLLKDALLVAREIGDKYERARVFTGLARKMSGTQQLETFEEALIAARAIVIPWRRAEALTELLSDLSGSRQKQVLKEALTAARQPGDMEMRARSFARLIPYLAALSTADLYTLWVELLHELVVCTRDNIYADLQVLVPVIARLGSLDAVTETFRAIQDVGRWWP